MLLKHPSIKACFTNTLTLSRYG